MIYITPKEKIDEYYASGAVNQSKLKALIYGLNSYKRQMEKQSFLYYEDEPEHFIIGSAVDIWITQGGVEAVRERYYISSLASKPSETMMSIIKAVFDTVVSSMESNPVIFPLSEYKETIIDSAKFHKWNAKYGDDALFNGVTREGSDYWNELVLSRGKQIMSVEEFTTVSAVANSLLTKSALSPYLTETEGSYDLFFQVPVYFLFQGERCKALLDIVQVHRFYGDTKIIELKTMSGRVMDFPMSLRKRRYDIQIAWYQNALVNNIKDALTAIFPEYELVAPSQLNLKAPSFIVESTTEPGNPMLFHVSEALLYHGMNGVPETYSETNTSTEIYIRRHMEIPGIMQLILKYRWYRRREFDMDHDYWRYSQRGYQFIIDWFGIIQDHRVPLIENPSGDIEEGGSGDTEAL